MFEAELGRVQGDLAVIRRAMGLHVSFGRGTPMFGVMLAVTAAAAAGLSLLGDSDPFQVALLGAMLTLGPTALHLLNRRPNAPDREAMLQVALACGTYGAVWVAACGYAMAAAVGPAVGPARTAGLYAAGICLLFAFSLMLVRTALVSRERLYALGLAVSPLLAGLLVPIVDRRYSYPVAHAAMAVGYLAAAAIQRGQLRKAVPPHAAD